MDALWDLEAVLALSVRAEICLRTLDGRREGPSKRQLMGRSRVVAIGQRLRTSQLEHIESGFHSVKGALVARNGRLTDQRLISRSGPDPASGGDC
jgi:hypothetical protein